MLAKQAYLSEHLFFRDKVECNLTFQGLIIMENKLKRQTRPVIRTLTSASIRSVMVTGKLSLGAARALKMVATCGATLGAVWALKMVETCGATLP